MNRLNRRGFFAALLAPLVVPFRPKPTVNWTQWPRWWSKSRLQAHQVQDLQRRMNELYNARVDYMTLSLRG